MRSLSQICLLGCLWDRQHAPEAVEDLPELPAEQLCSHHTGLQLGGTSLLGGVKGRNLTWGRWSREADL